MSSTTLFQFTKRTILALPAHDVSSDSSCAEYTDSITPGLKCSVTKKGKKTFLFRFTAPDRKKACMKIGDAMVNDLAKVRQQVMSYRQLLDAGIDPRHKQSDDKDVIITFGDFFRQHYTPEAKARKKSWKDDSSKFKLYLNPAFGAQPLNAIKTKDVQAYYTQLAVQGLQPATANRHLALLSAIFNMAIRYEFITGLNPCGNIKKNKENNQRQRTLNADELVRFWAALDDCNPETMEPNRVAVNVIKLLMLTGTRREEALHAEWAHVDLQGKIWTIPDGKSGKARHVPLNDGALELLQSISKVRGCPYVFVNPRTKKRYNSPVKTFKRLLKKAGIKEGGGLCIHSLRHQFATLLVTNGVTLYEAQKLLGHSSSAMTQRYAHLSGATLHNASNVVSNIIKETRQLRGSNAN